MNRKFIVIFILCFQTVIWAQIEKVVNSPLSLIELLRKEQSIKFSFVEDVTKINQETTIVKLPMSQNEITRSFNRFGCDVKFIDNVHVLIRQSDFNKQDVDTNPNELTTLIIIDDNSGKPIDWASAYEHNLEGGVLFSDERGRITIGDVKGDVVISQLGYEKITIPVNVLNSKKYHLVKLKSIPFEIDQIIKYETIITFQTEGDFERIKNTKKNSLNNKGIAGRDVLAIIQNLPGVDASAESSGQLKVRGSKAEETLILLDMVPLINAGHYFEMFSAVNPLYVEKIGFYKNSLPIEFMGGAAALVTLAGPDKIPSKIKGELDLNLLSMSGTMTIPLTNKIAISAALRKSTTNISNNKYYSLSTRSNMAINQDFKNGEIGENIFNSYPSFGFYDANIKAIYAYKNTKASISYFQLNDDFENMTQFDLNNRPQNIPNPNLNFVNSFINSRSWNSSGLGFDINQTLTKKWTIDFNAYHSKYVSDYLLKSEIGTAIGFSKSLSNTILKSDVAISGSKIKSNYKISDVLNIMSGYSLDHINNANTLNDNKGNNINIAPSGYINTIFNELSYSKNKVKATIGMRNIYNTNLAAWHTSPQLLVNVFANDELTFKTSLARNYQFHRKIELRELYDQSLGFWTMSGRGLPVLKNDTYMIGANFKKDGLKLDVELYRKNMSGVAEYINPNPALKIETTQIERLELFTGKGKTNGLDFLARYDGHWLSSQLSYTLSKLTYQIDGIFLGKEYAAPNDRRHQMKLLTSFKFKQFMVNYNTTLATGTPYVIASRIPENTRFKNITQTSVINRLPNYLRNDIGFTYQFKKFSLDHTISFDIFNLFNRTNIKQVQYLSLVKDKNTKAESLIVGTNTNMLNRTLSLGYGIKF